MGRSRDKRKKQKVKREPSSAPMGVRWTRVWAKSLGGHPTYLSDSPDIKFARRAIGMALTASKNRRLVDIGAGRGEITSTVSRAGGHVTLVDPAGVKAMNQKMPFERVRAYGQKLPKEWTGKFGVAVMNYSLSYARKEKPKALAEARRVLDKGGRLIAMVHHPNSRYVKEGNLTKPYFDAAVSLLENVRRKRIKRYDEAAEVLERIAQMPGATQVNIDLVNGVLENYFKRKKAVGFGPSGEKALDRNIAENIERMKIQEASFGPLHEPGNLFQSEAEVRRFFEESGFRVRFLRTLKKGNDIYCYAVYAEKIAT